MKIILCFLLFPVSVFAQNTVPVDSLYYCSSFFYTQEEIDAKLFNSPEVVLHMKQVKARKHSNSFVRNLSLHLTYSPFEELIPESKRIWIGFNIPLGKMFQDTKELDDAEFKVLLISLKLQSRELLKKRQELLERLELDIKMYRTAIIKLRKSEVELSVKELSSDDVMSTEDRLSQLLTEVKKRKLEIQLIEDKLKALIGEL